MTPEAVAALEDERLRVDARRNLARILEAAQQVFAESGLSAGVAEVARRAGVGNATIFRRFPQKEDLIVAVLERLMRRRIEEQRAALPEASSGAVLRHFIERMVDWQVRDRGLLESMPAGLLGDPRLRPLRDELSEVATAYVRAAQTNGEIRDDITFEDLAVLCHALAQIGVDLAESAPDAWRRYLAITVAGLRPDGTPLPGSALGWDAICAAKARVETMGPGGCAASSDGA